MLLKPTPEQSNKLQLVTLSDVFGELEHSNAGQIPDEGSRSMHNIQRRASVELWALTPWQMQPKSIQSLFIDGGKGSSLGLNKVAQVCSRPKVAPSSPP
jgi:hypothetical protein